jgi:outer membrane protein OmpA-like peptidoglycan-associated protein
MSGLMVLFLFIAICYMLQARQEGEKAIIDKDLAVAKAAEATASAEDAERQRGIVEKQAKKLEEQRQTLVDQKDRLLQSNQKIREIAAAYTELEAAIYDSLQKEFEHDLPLWNATLERDNTIRFNEPEVLFETGKRELRGKFREILNNFFPRYLKTIYQPRFRAEIAEIRIEGHTSSQWKDARNAHDRYLLNAELSQGRALAVLDFCFRLPEAETHRDLMIRDLRANGLSFARPVLGTNNQEDPARSQRVEFRVVSKTRERILRILETDNEGRYDNPDN